VPSTSDAAGGKNFHVYAKSFNGGALQVFDPTPVPTGIAFNPFRPLDLSVTKM
jgi:hypothetical protein